MTSSGSRWDKINDGINPAKAPIIEPKTIIISQPSAGPSSISNTEPLTEEYLNSILPSVGYKIVPIPKKYVRQQSERVLVQEIENPETKRIPQEFQKLYTDTRPDEELTQEEHNERFVMKLLMQIKEGSVYQRKQSIRLLTTHAPNLGAELIFSKFIPLINSSSLSELERHSLIKTLDRLMYRLSSHIVPYVPQLLRFVGPMLIDREPVTRAEGREVTSNLAKITGWPEIVKALRASLDSEDEDVRSITSQILATTATAVGYDKIFPLLRAMFSSKRSWCSRHTALRVIDGIAFQNRNGILPHLDELVKFVLPMMDDEEDKVRRQAVKCTKALAEAAAPYGGEVFDKLTEKVLSGFQSPMHKFCLAAMAALILTMKTEYASTYFHRLFMRLGHSFESQDIKEKISGLTLFENALIKDAVQIVELQALYDPFFRGYWNQRATLSRALINKVVDVTVMIAEKSSMSDTIRMMRGDFKVMSNDYKCACVQCIRELVKRIGLKNMTPEDIVTCLEDILFAYENIDDEKSRKHIYKCLEEFLAEAGGRVQGILEYVQNAVEQRTNMPHPRQRERGALIISAFAHSFAICESRPPLIHFYEKFQEMFVEEYPNVLAAVLTAAASLARELKLDEMRTKPDEVMPRLVPILKNRNDQVAFACVNLISTLTTKADKIADNKEWMRICFELIELLKSDKRKVRQGAINAFSQIAKAISPFDVLLALLNNLRVQDRQIRLCTTIAIAVLAENVGPHMVLPALMNEYRTPDMNVQNGALKAMQYLFQGIGRECADYCYAVTPLLTYALIERDNIHRQQACAAVTSFAIGCFGAGKEDALLHLFNHLIPNVFESSMHFVESFMNSMEAMRLSLGPGIVLMHTLAGLFHPARKVRSQFWRIYNQLVIYAGGELVPYYPIMKSSEKNTYHRDDFDVFV